MQDITHAFVGIYIKEKMLKSNSLRCALMSSLLTFDNELDQRVETF